MSGRLCRKGSCFWKEHLSRLEDDDAFDWEGLLDETVLGG